MRKLLILFLLSTFIISGCRPGVTLEGENDLVINLLPGDEAEENSQSEVQPSLNT